MRKAVMILCVVVLMATLVSYLDSKIAGKTGYSPLNPGSNVISYKHSLFLSDIPTEDGKMIKAQVALTITLDREGYTDADLKWFVDSVVSSSVKYVVKKYGHEDLKACVNDLPAMKKKIGSDIHREINYGAGNSLLRGKVEKLDIKFNL